ncbi:hypothetical protein NLG97_g1868 [Lecanicillium saksenae]|uniref:Uncharacterized protein n=1 Tax=Lecanicillium saksenae TaxID=468837 RepID=A0ACC1R570_9HYPO|nr:hypothetical protein NLG97_g1868 [Lecanicillium saksenae]
MSTAGLGSAKRKRADPRLPHDDYTVGWICALTSEYVAAQVFLDEEHGAPVDTAVHDNNDYTLGSIGSHNVVIAVLPDGEYGTASAAGVARDMLSTFHNIRIGLMVGIAGGAPTLKNDIRLGDVVVGEPRNGLGAVFQYDFGKSIQDQPFCSTRFLAPPPTLFLTAINGLKAKYERYGNTIKQDVLVHLEAEKRLRKKYSRPETATDVLCRSDVIHPPEEPSCLGSCTSNVIARPDRDEDEDDSVVHYGLIGTANQLMKDAKLRDQYARDRGILCFEMEAGGLVNHFPCLVIRGICDYSDTHKNKQWQGYAAMAAAAYAKDLLHRISPNQVEKERAISTVLESFGAEIKNVQSTAVEVRKDIQSLHKSVLDAHQSMVLDRLHIAEGASFDSYAQEHNRYCLPNTRVELFKLVEEWAKDVNAESGFWLNGMAGTGKSTIARTVAKLFADTGQLGASFFFKKGEIDRGSLSKFFMTIAADLAVKRPSTAPFIEAALNADRLITAKNATEQFQKLLLEPLSKSDIGSEPVVIIVDALDECVKEDDIQLLLHLVSQIESKLPDRARIFLTSRPEEPFRSHFEKIKQTKSRVILHEISQTVIEHDIHLFLKHELSGIRAEFNNRVSIERHLGPSWPSKPSVDGLVKLAVPLFIVAATICRFIGDKRLGTPEKLLDSVLSQPGDGLPPLQTTYRSVLDNLTAGVVAGQREQIITEFRQVVGSIVLLGSPLSAHSLAKLLDISTASVDTRLDMLHSVLSIPTSPQAPVRLLHLSFRDFLLHPDDPTMPFRVDAKQTHANLAAHCLRILSCLKKDPCNVRSPGTRRSEISVEAINSALPPELQYACLYWVHHLEKANAQLSDGGSIYAFLKEHFLHWMEALALIGRASDGLGFLKALQLQTKGTSNPKLLIFLEDAIPFLQPYMSIIISHPLQLYSSLLIFSPTTSEIRKIFEASNERPRWICLKPRVKEYWDNCLQTLEGHDDAVISVAFSRDSTLVASGSCDRTIRIWRADTAECTQVLTGHDGSVGSLVFSRDSTVLASGSNDDAIRIWHTNTNKCVQMLQGQTGTVLSMAFSDDSTYLASGSDDTTLRLWHVETGNCVTMLTLKGHSDPISSIAFSHDMKHVASSSYDGTLRIWRADSGDCVRTLKGHNQSVWRAGFSSDSTLVTSSAYAGHRAPITSMVFSHDATLVASSSDDNTVRIWDVSQGMCLHTLSVHGGLIKSVAFSHDSTLVASGSKDGTMAMPARREAALADHEAAKPVKDNRKLHYNKNTKMPIAASN